MGVTFGVAVGTIMGVIAADGTIGVVVAAGTPKLKENLPKIATRIKRTRTTPMPIKNQIGFFFFFFCFLGCFWWRRYRIYRFFRG